MACNLLLKTHFNIQLDVLPHGSGFDLVTETISIPLVKDGKITDQSVRTTVTKKVELPVMSIDQTISANDLTLQSSIENGVTLQPVNFSIDSDSPELVEAKINSMVNAIRNSRVVPSNEVPVSSSPETESNLSE